MSAPRWIVDCVGAGNRAENSLYQAAVEVYQQALQRGGNLLSAFPVHSLITADRVRHVVAIPAQEPDRRLRTRISHEDTRQVRLGHDDEQIGAGDQLCCQGLADMTGQVDTEAMSHFDGFRS